MKELSLERMESIEGGSIAGCAGLVAGAIGIVALFTVAAPVTLGASIWLSTQAIAAGVGTGLSLADCADL